MLRAGLTTKALDPVGLVQCLEEGMSRLARVTPEPFGFSTDVFRPGVDEFALAVSQCSKAEPGGTLLLAETTPDQNQADVSFIFGLLPTEALSLSTSWDRVLREALAAKREMALA